MKTFIQDLGYKFTTNDDLTDRQFRNVDTNLEYDEELSTMGNPRHIIESVWQIALKNYNPILFNTRLLKMYDDITKGLFYYLCTSSDNYLLVGSDDTVLSFNGGKKNLTNKDVFYYDKSTNDKGEFYIESYSIDTEKEENRTLINLTFIIRGN